MTGTHRTVDVECAPCGRRGRWDMHRHIVIHAWNQKTGEPSVFCELPDSREKGSEC